MPRARGRTATSATACCSTTAATRPGPIRPPTSKPRRAARCDSEIARRVSRAWSTSRSDAFASTPLCRSASNPRERAPRRRAREGEPCAWRRGTWRTSSTATATAVGSRPEARRARELERQRAKIAAALAAVDADVFALAEIENDGTGPGSAAHELAAALSERIGAPVAVVDPGRGALGEQEISVGLLYRSDRVAPVGVPAVLDANADPDFDTSRNRPSLARSFVHAGTGERVTVAINHWKSKGSPCDGATDPDVGDGQGNCNRTRARAAASLASWLATDPTRAGAPALIVGDLNSYPNEDPLA